MNNKTIKANSKEVAQFIPRYSLKAQALIYKTKKDYNNLVFVLLSDDKTKIISYPHPSALRIGKEYLIPTLLTNGYLIDNRGIGKNVAFLKLIYQEYFELEEVLTLAELDSYIIQRPSYRTLQL